MHKRDNSFPGLDLLRFYAAFSVIVGHLTPDATAGIPLLNSLLMDARDAVTLFFVLSGFLITHLLLSEKRTTGTIDLTRFYLRRAFRILPLYYLILLIGFMIEPMTTGAKLLALTLLPNVANSVAALGHFGFLWSIGVEEQFYFTVPLLLRKFRRPITIFWLVIALSLIIPTIILGLGFRGVNSPLLTALSVLFVNGTRYGALAIGGIGAVLVLRRSKTLGLIYHPITQCLALALAGAFIANDMIRPWVTLYWIDFALTWAYFIILVNVATNPQSILRLPRRNAQALGDLSYSMYMTHPLVIIALTNLKIEGSMLLILTVVLTLIASKLTFQFYERPFLALRNRLGAPQQSAASIQITPVA